jgi:gamma-glutamyl:cysteine ligase YbdK (ATP-grasp superfamily)
MLFGFEGEYRFSGSSIEKVLSWDLPGLHAEFFKFMVEVISEPFEEIKASLDQLQKRIGFLIDKGVKLEEFASAAYEQPAVDFEQVTKKDDYYAWVYEQGVKNAGFKPIDLHHVSYHITVSDEKSFSEEMVIDLANRIRQLNFLFILVTLNSPLKNGQLTNYLSRRTIEFPNNYQAPLWQDPAGFWSWVAECKQAGLIYRDKQRGWLPITPRITGDGSKKLTRIELRSLDGGTNIPTPTLEGCALLLERIIKNSDDDFHQVLVPDITKIESNDKTIARLGRQAKVNIKGKEYPVLDIARYWFKGITQLEKVLDEGSPAEQLLEQMTKTKKAG